MHTASCQASISHSVSLRGPSVTVEVSPKAKSCGAQEVLPLARQSHSACPRCLLSMTAQRPLLSIVLLYTQAKGRVVLSLDMLTCCLHNMFTEVLLTDVGSSLETYS